MGVALPEDRETRSSGQRVTPSLSLDFLHSDRQSVPRLLKAQGWRAPRSWLDWHHERHRPSDRLDSTKPHDSQK